MTETMSRPLHYLNANIAEHVVTEILESLAKHPLRSAEAFRECLLGDALFAVNPLLKMAAGKDGDILIESLLRALVDTVREGRVIDFGYIPNITVKAESLRARAAYEAGDLLHPYEDRWVGLTSWEGGYNAYYVEPKMPDGSTLVLELYGVSMPRQDAILLYDAVRITPVSAGDTRVYPAPIYHPTGMNERDLAKFEESRAANSLDPLVTMLRLLADATIPVIPIPAPDRLNRQRVKHGKYEIPPYTRVDTKDYVATFTSHASPRGPGRGGSHASPIAHWRRSHLRRIAPDRVVKVRSSQVNWRSNEEIHRLFYRLPKQETATQH